MADEKQDITRTTLQWVAGQPFNNVLLLMILASIAWVSYHGMTVAIPAHLKQIQEGYERIEESNNRDRDMIIKQYDKWFESIQKQSNGDSTGRVNPSDIMEKVWSRSDATDSKFSPYARANGIAYASPGRTFEVTTPNGTSVSWTADKGYSDRSMLRAEERGGRGGGGIRSSNSDIADQGGSFSRLRGIAESSGRVF